MSSPAAADALTLEGILGGADDQVEQADLISWIENVAATHEPPGEELTSPVIPVAFVARVSGAESQDPTLSIPRQLSSSENALPPSCTIVAFFWDIESGRIDANKRGHGDSHQLFEIGVPRDGGLAKLLEEAARPDRRFVAAVCESVDRISRNTYDSLQIEHELEKHGVPLLAADEGISADSLPNADGQPVRKRATPVLTRRMKQVIAEWYVLELLEKSWGGLIEHNEAGFNIGKPPYGYNVITMPHPAPAKAALGRVKRRLVKDPTRGPVVTRVFAMRAVMELSYKEIAEQLNRDLALNPPPEPIPGRGRRAVGKWTDGSVREICHNPKYTGHMVYNRRKNPRKKRGVPGRVNPRSAWVWSSKPRHEPLVTRHVYDLANARGISKKGSRPGAQPNRHPATHRTYRTAPASLRFVRVDPAMPGNSHVV